MFPFALLCLVVGVLVVVAIAPLSHDEGADGETTMAIFCCGLALILAAVCAFTADVRQFDGKSAGAWRKLDAQATISAVGGPSWDEFQATAEAESAAWELRAAQAVATAGAPGGGQ